MAVCIYVHIPKPIQNAGKLTLTKTTKTHVMFIEARMKGGRPGALNLTYKFDYRRCHAKWQAFWHHEFHKLTSLSPSSAEKKKEKISGSVLCLPTKPKSRVKRTGNIICWKEAETPGIRNENDASHALCSCAQSRDLI